MLAVGGAYAVSVEQEALYFSEQGFEALVSEQISLYGLDVGAYYAP
jgi:hypothetical protein